jgi:hypothetical protein
LWQKYPPANDYSGVAFPDENGRIVSLIPSPGMDYLREFEGSSAMYSFIGYAGVATASVVLWWALIKLTVDVRKAF